MPSREEILAAADLKRQPIEIPEWGGTFFVSEMDGIGRGELEQESAKHAKAGTLRAHHRALIVIASLTDESGKRIFGYEDVEALGRKSAKVLDRIAEQVDKVNKISDSEIEDLAKN